jgi:putative transposase
MALIIQASIMLGIEFKVRKPKPEQCLAIEEAILKAQFVRNKCLRYWMDNRGVGKYDIYKYNTRLREEYQFVKDLNSHATQGAKKNTPGKKGYPKFKKHSRCVEYKVSGWKLSEDRKRIIFTDKKAIGSLKLIVSRDLNYFELEQVKRCRIIKRADGYYVQFVLKLAPRDTAKPFCVTQKCVGLDVGLKEFYADSNGHTEPIPQFYRSSEKQPNRANRKKSKKYRKGFKQSSNYHKARNRYALKHLRVSRQREEYCKRAAYCVIQSNDLVAYEDLNVFGTVRNRKLAKTITDAGWSTFRQWLESFGYKYGKATVALPAHHTSQIYSNCGAVVKKSLSTRTHVCECGYNEDRDVNAAINILQRGLNTLGHSGIYAWRETPSWAIGASLSSNGDSLNQESPRL